MEGFLITTAFFVTVYGIVRLAIRRKERMAAIEKGLNPMEWEKKENPTLAALKLGLVLIGIGTGVLIGSILVETTTINPDQVFFSMICLGGGIALVLNYVLGKKIMAEQQKNQENQNVQ
jgi:hypothetical protein